jgi:uncharacterized protein with PIN domain
MADTSTGRTRTKFNPRVQRCCLCTVAVLPRVTNEILRNQIPARINELNFIYVVQRR